MPSFDVQHLTDYDKMRYYCAIMQPFAAHYSTGGNWPKPFTALIRVIFQINTHFTHLFGKRCWNFTILLWQKPFWSVNIQDKPTLKVAFGNGNDIGAIFENSTKLRFPLRDVTMAKTSKQNGNLGENPGNEVDKTNKLSSSPRGLTQGFTHPWYHGLFHLRYFENGPLKRIGSLIKPY